MHVCAYARMCYVRVVCVCAKYTRIHARMCCVTYTRTCCCYVVMHVCAIVVTCYCGYARMCLCCYVHIPPLQF